MGGNSREGHHTQQAVYSVRLPCYAGGKAKPLKAPKKEKKELDEDDIAHLEKLKAGKQ